MTSTIQRCHPDLKKYVIKHSLPDVFEALFSALAINKPPDSREFMIEKLKLLQADQDLYDNLHWDSFIDPDKKPTRRLPPIDFSWCYDDTMPTPEMLEKAYNFYNHKLLSLCFNAFLEYWMAQTEKRRILAAKFAIAVRMNNKINCRRIFMAWRKWHKKEKRRQLIFIIAIRKIYENSLCREVFNAWRKIAEDTKKTKEYFEKIERGEVHDNVPIEESDRKDHISLLPKMLAVHVFRYIELPDLVNCSKVCQSWKEITQFAMLWSRIDLANTDRSVISSKAITNLLQKCRPFLCHLNVRNCNFLHYKTLISIGDCRNLQDLNISSCQAVNDDVIQIITNGCSTILYMNMSHTSITDASIRSLSRNCNSLQFLNMSHCLNVSNRGMLYLANGKGSQKLSYLDMSGCEQISRDGYKFLSKGCFRLNTLLLNEMPSLTDDSIEALMSECKNIRSISALHSPLLTDSAIRFMCHSKRLQTLKVEGNNRFTDACIKTLVRTNPELRFLYFVDIHRITDMSLKALGLTKNLQILNMADCVRISDAGVRYLAEGMSGSKLRELNLTNCIRVSDVSLLRISQRCTSLVYVNLSYCEHITDAGVELLADIMSLISVDLSGCSITDVGLVAMGNNPNFRDITVSECCSITDLGVQKLAPYVMDLENLDFSHLTLITDQSFKNLAFSCRRLRALNLAGCTQLTDQGIQYLCGVCQFIEKIDISGCILLTDRAVRYIRKGCPNLKKLAMLYCRNITKSSVLRLRGKINADVTHTQDDPVLQMGIKRDEKAPH